MISVIIWYPEQIGPVEVNFIAWRHFISHFNMLIKHNVPYSVYSISGTDSDYRDRLMANIVVDIINRKVLTFKDTIINNEPLQNDLRFMNWLNELGKEKENATG